MVEETKVEWISLDKFDGIYYESSKGNKSITKIDRHTFRNHEVLVEE